MTVAPPSAEHASRKIVEIASDLTVTPQRKPALPFTRVSAKFVDLFLILIVALIADKFSDKVGPLIGILYSFCSDRVWRGQSIGKRLFKLQVIGLARPREISLKDSIIRNSPIGVATCFAMVPFPGWILLGVIGFPMILMEIYLLIKAPNAQRLGDVMADTVVVTK